MIGSVMIYLAGAATGVALMLINRVSITRAVSETERKLNKTIAQQEGKIRELTETCDQMKLDRGYDGGYKRGYDIGYDEGIERGRNMSQGELLEDTLSRGGRRRVKMGGESQ